MESRKQHIDLILQRPGRFLWRVLVGFKRNQGLLLAGAVAYYTLLSIIPMLALILVWYYSTISLVNVIYGSLATAVVALLSIEIAVIILLLGAQVIAEFEHSINETTEPGQSELAD